MNKDSALNIAFIGIGLCLLCSAIISLIAIQLRSVQNENVVKDMQKKIVSSAGLELEYGSVENAMMNIKTIVVDLDQGKIVDINPNSYELSKELREEGKYKFLSAENDIASIKKREKYSKVFIEYKDDKINTLILPVRGYGLWGILYGYLAIKSDFNTVAGLEFYEHKETPGLGAEIDNPKWKALWKGKKIYQENGEVSLKVIKGNVLASSDNINYEVDGLSGATLTCNGVTNLIAYWMGSDGFLNFINNLRELDV
tara:strand:+ start:5765 stop:6532 length:768 start_codon:yes stop_codon:yes gene_type:complete